MLERVERGLEGAHPIDRRPGDALTERAEKEPTKLDSAPRRFRSAEYRAAGGGKGHETSPILPK